MFNSTITIRKLEIDSVENNLSLVDFYPSFLYCSCSDPQKYSKTGHVLVMNVFGKTFWENGEIMGKFNSMRFKKLVTY